MISIIFTAMSNLDLLGDESHKFLHTSSGQPTTHSKGLQMGATRRGNAYFILTRQCRCQYKCSSQLEGEGGALSCFTASCITCKSIRVSLTAIREYGRVR